MTHVTWRRRVVGESRTAACSSTTSHHWFAPRAVGKTLRHEARAGTRSVAEELDYGTEGVIFQIWPGKLSPWAATGASVAM